MLLLKHHYHHWYCRYHLQAKLFATTKKNIKLVSIKRSCTQLANYCLVYGFSLVGQCGRRVWVLALVVSPVVQLQTVVWPID